MNKKMTIYFGLAAIVLKLIFLPSCSSHQPLEVRLVSELVGHSDLINSIAFSPDAQFLASGGLDKSVKIWKVGDRQLVRTLKHNQWVTSVAFSPDGNFLATGSWDSIVRIWRIKDGKMTKSLNAHKDIITSAAFSPCGKFLASASRDRKVILWEVDEGKLMLVLKHEEIPDHLSFSQDGRLLAVAVGDGTVRIWRVEDGKLVKILRGHSGKVLCVSFSPDDSLLASSAGAPDNSVRVWKVKGSLDKILKHGYPVRSIAFSKDSRLLAGAGGFTIRLWQLPEGKVVWDYSVEGTRLYRLTHELEKLMKIPFKKWFSMKKLPVLVMTLAFSPDGKFLAAGFSDGGIRIWRVLVH